MKQLLIMGIGFFLILMFLMYFGQRSLIYLPSKESPSRRIYGANDMEAVTLKTEDDLQLLSWYKPAKKGLPTLLYLHGNAGHIGYRMPLIRQFLNKGMGVLLLGYRGYGGNEGQPSETGLYQDGQAAVQFLQTRGVALSQLVLYGESLGTGVATKLAESYKICGIILQTPYTSLAALARYHYPWIFIKPWDRFDSLSRMSAINAPLLILHGTDDNIVPVSQAHTLYQAANEPKRLEIYDKGSHLDLWNHKTFVNDVVNFITTHCSQPQ